MTPKYLNDETNWIGEELRTSGRPLLLRAPNVVNCKNNEGKIENGAVYFGALMLSARIVYGDLFSAFWIHYGCRPRPYTMAASPAEPEALKHSFSYLVNSIDTAAPPLPERNALSRAEPHNGSTENGLLQIPMLYRSFRKLKLGVLQRAEKLFSLQQPSNEQWICMLFRTSKLLVPEATTNSCALLSPICCAYLRQCCLRLMAAA